MTMHQGYENRQVIYEKTLDAAAKQLSYRAVSTAVLRQKLIEKGFPEEAVNAAIEWLQVHGLLDDAAYAQSVVRSYQRRGYGEMRIQQELRRRGIPSDAAQEAMETFAPEFEKMIALLDKKLKGEVSDRRQVDKAAAALQRRGYRWTEIRKALDAYTDGLRDDEL